jgi:formylglycine-generating enzyme required for sulfatase activity
MEIADTTDTHIVPIIILPAITTQPASLSVVAGDTATFTIAATGDSLSYQWQKNDTNITGATSAVYIIPATTPADSGNSYKCIVWNSTDTLTSNTAILTVNMNIIAPVITTQPISQSVIEGDTATFTIAATGTSLSYQWQKNNANIPGATSTSYTIPATAMSDSGAAYRCIVQNIADTLTSNAAILTVNRVVVTIQPANQYVTIGNAATFNVAATGTLLQYQWQKNSADIIGASSSSYITPASTIADNGAIYRCIVWNGAGKDTSNTAMLSVAPGGMRLIQAKDSSFLIGDTVNAAPVHQVNFTYDFYVDTTEVTQVDYLTLMGVNPSDHSGVTDGPVEKITWFDAVLYCNERSKRDLLDTVYSYTAITGTFGNGCSDLTGLVIDFAGNGYRLPTEAEWEYSCRAKTITEYYWGNVADVAYAWYLDNSGSTTHTVATRQPNSWGLYDMSGNVWEWCNDWYDVYGGSTETDPTGPVTSPVAGRVARGGCWGNPAANLRSYNRGYRVPGNSSNYHGLRVCLPAQ